VWGTKQKSDRKVTFLCVIDYLVSAEIYNWVENNTLVIYKHYCLYSTTQRCSEHQQYTHSSLLDVYVNNYVCAIKQYIWFTFISSRKTAKTFHVYTHTCHHVKQLKHFMSTLTHAYRTFVYAVIPTTRAICLADTSLAVTICPIWTVTSWHESLSTTLNMHVIHCATGGKLCCAQVASRLCITWS